MAPHRLRGLLEPVDLAEYLDKLELGFGQVCQLAEISRMQLDYWTEKARIPTKGRKHRIYGRDSVETVLLIKQARDQGLGLQAAIEAAARVKEQDPGDRHRGAPRAPEPAAPV